jgi:hypothetical protein
MGIEEVLTAPHSPWQNPFAERIIGSIRRECLDHVLVLGERHLRRILTCYFRYYHQAGTHPALDKDAPELRPVELPAAGRIVQLPEVGGLAGTRKAYLAAATAVPLLIIDDLGMRKLPSTAAEDLLEIVMRRYERAATLLTSNRPVEDWGKLLGDTGAVTALLDRVLHHAHVLTCGPRSWRTRLQGERSSS